MRILLLSAGAGKRIWPLAGRGVPGQYWQSLEGPGGEPESMLQRLWRQLDLADFRERAFVSACREESDVVKQQLGPYVPLIVQPGQRGAFPALALAAAYMHHIAGVSPNETIIAMPAKACVRNDFFQCVRDLPKLLRDSGSQLLAVGLPARRSGGRGDYIVPEQPMDEEHGDSRVQSFVANPSEFEAERLLRKGALRSSGVYAFKLELVLDKLSSLGMPLLHEELYAQYNRLPKRSIEEAMMRDERTVKSVILYEGHWESWTAPLLVSEHTAVLP